MIKVTHNFGFIAALLIAGGSHSAAQDTSDLKVYTAVEIEYQTEVGKSYQLQGAVNLTNWTPVGNTVLGHGRRVNRIFSTKDPNAVPYAAYRLHVVDGPTNGYAPWSLAGAQLQMDSVSSSNYVEYVDSDRGHDVYSGQLDPFTYEFSRVDENNGRVERSYTSDRREVVTYSYTAPGTGSWVREEYRQGNLERRVSGVFRYLAQPTNTVSGNPPPGPLVSSLQPPAPPNVLTGLVYYALSGARPDQLTFLTSNSGLERPVPTLSGENENEVSSGGNTFTYSYQVLSSNTASLVINFGYYGFGGDKNEYDLTFTDGSSGTFVRRIYRLGALYSTDTGAFSPFNQLSSTVGNPSPTPGDSDQPPTSPVGLTLTVQDDSVPRRLVFQSSATGIEYDDSAPSDFGFSYQATGNSTFSLVVRFKADKWDEYDLTFSNGRSGTAIRREYKNNRLNRTTSGPFTMALTGQ